MVKGNNNTVIIAGCFVDTSTIAQFGYAQDHKTEIIVVKNNESLKNESEVFKISKYDIEPISSLEIKDGKALRRERRKKDKKK